ncbi:MAG: hypothetical protein HQL24_08685 [Candidatus Omnitrophica bacterium]|nr:hypothetical protein [Candidatus Omnitrophota bacterium]
MREIKNYKNTLSFIALTLIGMVCLGYFLFCRVFAEIHMWLPFFSFPIFVGEILMAISFVFYLFAADLRTFKSLHWWIVAFYVFVLLKALFGYYLWGPLAFRHAALFYYTIFIVFGYTFYRKEFFRQEIKVTLSVLLILLIRFFSPMWAFSIGIFTFIFINAIRKGKIRVFLYGLLFLVFPYSNMIMAARTVLLGHLAALVFLIIVAMAWMKTKKYFKIAGSGALILFVLLIMMKFSSVNAFSSIFNFKETVRLFAEADSNINAKKSAFVPSPLKSRIYNPQKESARDLIEARQVKVDRDLDVTVPTDGGIAHTEVVPASQGLKIATGRNVQVAYVNSVFRLLIWRDMGKELIAKKQIFGFDFGWPLRSPSLEILNWAKSEWSRDGWIEAHNSYFDMIYRAGIVGLVFIVFLLGLLCFAIRESMILRSVPGILLCAVLLAWFVGANFLLIFELPYTAIPIWTLLGLTLGFLKDKRTCA